MFTWSKVQHDLYKWDNNFPQPVPLMRRIFSCNALLEITDKELQSIQTETRKLKKYDIRDTFLDLEKLKAFCEQYFLK